MKTFYVSFLILAVMIKACWADPTMPASANDTPNGQPYSYYGNLHHMGSSLQCGVTALILENVGRAIQNYAIEKHKFPEGDLPTVITNLMASHFLDFEQYSQSYRALFLDSKKQLLDGWGNKIIIKRSVDGLTMSLISPGQNGVIDQEPGLRGQAASDDIYVIVDMRTLNRWF
jgi:hypothetical protein